MGKPCVEGDRARIGQNDVMKTAAIWQDILQVLQAFRARDEHPDVTVVQDVFDLHRLQHGVDRYEHRPAQLIA